MAEKFQKQEEYQSSFTEENGYYHLDQYDPELKNNLDGDWKLNKWGDLVFVETLHPAPGKNLDIEPDTGSVSPLQQYYESVASHHRPAGY